MLARAAHLAGRRLLTMLMAMARPSSLALVHGRVYEENSLRVALALPRHYAGRVVLLARDTRRARAQLRTLSSGLGRAPAAAGVEVVQVRSIRAVWLFLRARFVFYTHGLYGSPKPKRGRMHINLWHGHGPKRTGSTLIAQDASVMVSNTPTWGSWAARSRGMDEDALLVVGNPRQDAFDNPPPRRFLGRLGVDPDRPLVLWLPTRRDPTPGSAADPGDVPMDPAIDAAAGVLAAAADRLGVTLLVKGHPHGEDGLGAGVRIVDDDDIIAAGLSLYGLLSLSQGLLSDYSSVWVEYLELDRPIGLICPDLEHYEAVHGFKSPGLREVAGPLLLRTAAEMQAFLLDVSRGRDRQLHQRRRCMRRLGVRPRTRRTERLLQALNKRAAQHSHGEPFRGLSRPQRPAEQAATGSRSADERLVRLDRPVHGPALPVGDVAEEVR